MTACPQCFHVLPDHASLCSNNPKIKKKLLPNPKQAYGDLKVPLAFVPSTAVILMGEAFKEGARKYGPFNWREKAVEGMTYAHASLRHLFAWIDGETIDPESGKLHLAHALASLAIIVDAAATGCLIDNRPPKGMGGDLLRAKATASKPEPVEQPVVYGGTEERRSDSTAWIYHGGDAKHQQSE